MKRIRRTKIRVEQCRVVVSRRSAQITESIACPDCGRVFNPGDAIEPVAVCSPPGDRLLLTGGTDEPNGADK